MFFISTDISTENLTDLNNIPKPCPYLYKYKYGVAERWVNIRCFLIKFIEDITQLRMLT